MVNTRQKMYTANSKIRKFMEMNGFTNIDFFPHTRHHKDIHIDEEDFDGIATKDDEVVLFQCKTNRKQTKQSQEAYKDFYKKYKVRAYWFNYVPREGVTQTP